MKKAIKISKLISLILFITNIVLYLFCIIFSSVKVLLRGYYQLFDFQKTYGIEALIQNFAVCSVFYFIDIGIWLLIAGSIALIIHFVLKRLSNKE